MDRILCILTALLVYSASMAQDNLLRGRKAVFENRPDYGLTISVTDDSELTDGAFQENTRLWFLRECVGWYSSASVHAFWFDLGVPQDIGKVRLHASAGAGGVQWPDRLLVLAGDAPDCLAVLEDLVDTSRSRLPAYGEGQYTFWFESTFQPVRARYLKFLVYANQDFPYFFTDEIEALKAEDSAREPAPATRCRGSTEDFLRLERLDALFEEDSRRVLDNLARSGKPMDKSALAEIQARPRMPLLKLMRDDTDFPLNQAQTELSRLNQKALANVGLSGTPVWWTERWAPFHAFDWPGKKHTAEKCLLPGERRNLAFAIANAKTLPCIPFIRVSSSVPVWLSQVVCSMASGEFCNANRLEELAMSGDGWRPSPLEPGESRLFFLTVDVPQKTLPGEQNIAVTIDGAKPALECRILIGKVPFPQELSTELGLWDYLNRLGCHAQVIDESNLQDSLTLLRKYQFNLSWAHETALPFLKPEMFSDADELLVSPDFSGLDSWLARVGKFRSYAVFLGGDWKRQFNFGRDILKESASFRRRVTAFLSAMATHFENRHGIQADRVLIHCIDEACTPEQEALLHAWCIAVASATAPSGHHFRTYGNPAVRPNEILPRTEIGFLQPHCPYTPEKLAACVSIAESRPVGSQFGFYACLNRTRERDPYSYYALPFRFGFLTPGFRGVGFWNLGTAARGINECDYKGRTFSALYFIGNRIFSSRQWEAIFEAREDYEYLRMLQKCAERPIPEQGEAAALLASIRKKILDELPPRQNENFSLWREPKKRDVADDQTSAIWHLLQKIH